MRSRESAFLILSLVASANTFAQQIDGELKQWHDVVLTFEGQQTGERAEENPFFDYRLDVTFSKGSKTLVVPGYFAADGNAAETSATEGDKWRVHFVPDEVGECRYAVSFRTGTQIAVADDSSSGRPLSPDGAGGTLSIGPSEKTGRDHRAKGTLRYTGDRCAHDQGPGEPSIQVGARARRTPSLLPVRWDRRPRRREQSADRGAAPLWATHPRLAARRSMDGYLEGRVEEVTEGGVLLTFHTLHNGEKSVALASTPLSFVNSKGHPDRDDEERPASVRDGRVFAGVLNEGAEMRLEIRPGNR